MPLKAALQVTHPGHQYANADHHGTTGFQQPVSAKAPD
jgi:hypothetical protein